MARQPQQDAGLGGFFKAFTRLRRSEDEAMSSAEAARRDQRRAASKRGFFGRIGRRAGVPAPGVVKREVRGAAFPPRIGGGASQAHAVLDDPAPPVPPRPGKSTVAEHTVPPAPPPVSLGCLGLSNTVQAARMAMRQVPQWT